MGYSFVFRHMHQTQVLQFQLFEDRLLLLNVNLSNC